MRYRTFEEATAFVKMLCGEKLKGNRSLMTSKLDSVPAWGVGKTEHKLDGSEIEAVYLSYMEATDNQKEQAKPAKLAGVKLERISGRLVDVRKCADGTVQVLFTNGLRNADGSIPFRGPNVDKGILAYLSVGEGLGEPVEDIIARVPQALIDKLKATKAKLAPKKKAKAKKEDEVLKTVLAPVVEAAKESGVTLGELAPVPRGPVIIDVPSQDKPEPGEGRMKLK